MLRMLHKRICRIHCTPALLPDVTCHVVCDICRTYFSFFPWFAGAIQQKDSDLSIVADAVFEGNSAAFGGRQAAAVPHGAP